jgi:hypothetical protein
MLNPRTVNIYGYISIGVMTLMLVLMLARLVPSSMYMALFLIAAALFMIRITLRLVLARQQGEEKKGTQGPAVKGDEAD